MDDLIVTQREPVGDGTITIYARTPGGQSVAVVMSWDIQDTPRMWVMLRVAAFEADRRAVALAARRGRTDQGET